MDSVAYVRLQRHLDYLAQHGALIARLARVSDTLVLWRDGDEEAGRIAADALDQLHGLLAEMKHVLEVLEDAIPEVLRELPPFPE